MAVSFFLFLSAKVLAAASRKLAFFWQQKKACKENCRCFDAVRGCARGATVERSETGERTMIAPAGQSTARAGLRSKLAALVVRRQAGPAT